MKADFEIRETLDDLNAHPEILDSIPEDEQHNAAADILAERNKLYKRDIWSWLTDCVLTTDEATQNLTPWPSHLTYLKELLACVNECQMVAIPKSRRMMVSWALAAWCTHRARFFGNNAIFWQSETEDKSAFAVDKRCAFIEDNSIPEGLRRTYAAIRTTKGAIGRMTYRLTGSYIWAIPQGGAVLRTYTPSVLVMDESEFMPEAHQALTAALPAAEKGAKLILISSSNGPAGVLAGICKEIGFTRWGA